MCFNMKVVLSLALLSCLIGMSVSNCPDSSGHTREAYCGSVYAFRTVVLGDLGSNTNFNIYNISGSVNEDFKNLRRKNGSEFTYEFKRVYVDKACDPLQVDLEYLLIDCCKLANQVDSIKFAGNEKKTYPKYLKVENGIGQTRKWNEIEDDTITFWMREKPSCPMPQNS